MVNGNCSLLTEEDRVLLRAGTDGYVPKDATQEKLRVAIRSVRSGKYCLSRNLSAKVASGYLMRGYEFVSALWLNTFKMSNGHCLTWNKQREVHRE